MTEEHIQKTLNITLRIISLIFPLVISIIGTIILSNNYSSIKLLQTCVNTNNDHGNYVTSYIISIVIITWVIILYNLFKLILIPMIYLVNKSISSNLYSNIFDGNLFGKNKIDKTEVVIYFIFSIIYFILTLFTIITSKNLNCSQNNFLNGYMIFIVVAFGIYYLILLLKLIVQLTCKCVVSVQNSGSGIIPELNMT